MLSAASSISWLEVNPVSGKVVFLSVYLAEDADPTIFSPTVKSPVALNTSNSLVGEFQETTTAVTPEEEPVTVSFF